MLIRNPRKTPGFSRKALVTGVFLVQKQGCFGTNAAPDLGSRTEADVRKVWGLEKRGYSVKNSFALKIGLSSLKYAI